MTRRSMLLLFALSLALSAAAPLRAEPAAPPQPSAKQLAEERILDRLQTVTSIEYEEVPLAQVVERWRRDLGVNVVLDRRELESSGIEFDIPVTAKLNEVSYRAAIEHVLEPLELTWMIAHESLIVTSLQKSEAKLVYRVYDVTDLVAGENTYRPDFEPLIEVITCIIFPESWDEMGGPGAISGYESENIYVLAVAQTMQNHLDIEQFLADIRARRAKRPAAPRAVREKLEALKNSPLLRDDRDEEEEANDEAPSDESVEKDPPADPFGTSEDPFGVRLPGAPLLDASARRVAALRCNQFTFDLFRAAAADQERNDLFSCYGVRELLGLASLGAKGETHEELAAALQLPNNRQRAASELLAIREAMRRNPAGEFVLNVNNGLWVRERLPLNDEFAKLAQEFLGAPVKSLDFSHPGAAAEINRWAKESTNGLIPEIVDAGGLDANTPCFMASAIYFNGSWKTPFNAEYTRPKPFHVRDDAVVQVPTMSGLINCRGGLFDDLGLQIVELPYRGERLTMVLLLPAQREGALAELEKSLTAEDFARWISELKQNHLLVSIPKFKFTASYNLSAGLQKLGVERTFDARRADFSGIAAGPLWMKDAIHKACIDVNETGTEAAAITRGAFGASGIKSFVADRPFLFLLRDSETGAILFMGRVADPRGA